MARALKTAGAIYAMGIMIFALFFYMARRDQAAAPESVSPQSAASAQETACDGQLPLFPALNPDAITAISVDTPGRSFEFCTDGLGSVSVNGQQADSEIYGTLVSQIAQLPVASSVAFVPEDAHLLLTLTVCEDGAQHIARFYEDGGTGELARIIFGSSNAPQYAQTSGWRIGTLMMTCEGTRIQDERGQERPAALSSSAHDRP